MRKFDYVELAIKRLYPEVTGLSYDPTLDEVTLTVPSVELDQDAVRAEVLVLIDEQSNKAYQEKRKLEYPPIGDQLDALFKAGLFPPEMAAQIQAIKDKYPKQGAVND
jgi:hypothetical protein